MTIDDILTHIDKNKKTAFISGNFNHVHHGHNRLFAFAKLNADYVIVGVNPNDTQGALIDITKRIQYVTENDYIDFAFMLDMPLSDAIMKIKPDIIVKGVEYKNQINLEEKLCESYGGRLIFSSGDVFNDQKPPKIKNFNIANGYQQRHHIKHDDLINVIDNINHINAIIIGDVIIDEYVECMPLGMSREDPTIVVQPLKNEYFIGGAAIVAAHAASLGANVNFYSVCGDDAMGKSLHNMLQDYRFNKMIFHDNMRKTIHKKRYRAHQKTMLRVNDISQHTISKEYCKEIYHHIKNIICDQDIIIFADFNYGCLPQNLVDDLIDLAIQHDVKITADSQSSSQIGDISRYHDSMLLTPTEHEARIALNDNESGLVNIMQQLIDKTNSQHIILTLAENGAIGHCQSLCEGYITDEIIAMNPLANDVAGAGDSLFVTTSLAMSTGLNFWQSLYLGSLAAALQVKNIGNAPLQPHQLCEQLKHH